MPEMTLIVKWPDGLLQECCAPSLALYDHFAEGVTYTVLPDGTFRLQGQTGSVQLTFASTDDPAPFLKNSFEVLSRRHVEIGLNEKVDQVANAIDVVVYAEFPDEAALAAYKAHPTYAEATRRVRPLRELRFAADFPSRVVGSIKKRA